MTTPAFRRTAAVPPGLPVPLARGSRNVYLHPGQLFASDEPTVVTTVLGSCVSVCLWDRTSRVGGINHYVLPDLLPSDLSSPRFADFAMRDLVRRLLDLGVRRGSLEAKVFGGAGLSQMSARPGRRHLGEQNVSRALAVLEEERIPVVASDTGGSRGRKLMFRTDDGTVWLKAL